jgi:deazaflavin-dependent oxidoreductase (nitroreductase family)
MVKTYQVTSRQRRFNAFLVALLRRGLPLGPFYLLSVRGRKTGQIHCLPVTPIRHDDEWWLVSPYGEVDWVRNARVSGEVTLRRGCRHLPYLIRELSPTESAPILKEYVRRFGIIVRPYFAAPVEAPLEAFEAEAHYHPVFRLTLENSQT